MATSYKMACKSIQTQKVTNYYMEGSMKNYSDFDVEVLDNDTIN